MSRRVPKPNATGRNRERTGSKGAMIILRRSFWESAQVSALSCTAKVLLIELTSMYSGPSTNGRIYLSVRDATDRLGLSDSHAARAAIDELLTAGFLRESIAGHFASVGGKSKARAFWLNWKDEGGGPTSSEVLPDLDFGKLTAKQKRRVASRSRAVAAHRKNSFPVVDSTTLTTIRADLASESVVDSTTLKRGNGGKLPSRSMVESPTHIYYQGGSGAKHSQAPFMRAAQKGPKHLKAAMSARRRPGRGRPLLSSRLSFQTQQRATGLGRSERRNHARRT